MHDSAHVYSLLTFYPAQLPFGNIFILLWVTPDDVTNQGDSSEDPYGKGLKIYSFDLFLRLRVGNIKHTVGCPYCAAV